VLERSRVRTLQPLDGEEREPGQHDGERRQRAQAELRRRSEQDQDERSAHGLADTLGEDFHRRAYGAAQDDRHRRVEERVRRSEEPATCRQLEAARQRRGHDSGPCEQHAATGER
jgi:hypothetical protein